MYDIWFTSLNLTRKSLAPNLHFILRKSIFHQEQDWESIEVRIDEIKLGILIWEFNPWVLLMEVTGFSCFFVAFAFWLVFSLVHGLHVWFEHESMLACAFRSGSEWNLWICLGLCNSEILCDSYGEIDCWRLIYYMSSISV